MYNFDNISYEDASFTDPGGSHLVTHSFNTDAGRNSVDGWLICDGAGSIGVEISRDGLNYGNRYTVKKGERISYERISINKVRILWSADSAYRINLV